MFSRARLCSLICSSWITIALVIPSVGHGAEQRSAGYRVLSYDAKTHEWTILRDGVFDGEYQRKQLVVECVMYRWGNREPVNSAEACDLQIGRLMVPNPFSKVPEDFLDISEFSADTLSITSGKKPDRVRQLFKIRKYELLPSN